MLIYQHPIKETLFKFECEVHFPGSVKSLENCAANMKLKFDDSSN